MLERLEPLAEAGDDIELMRALQRRLAKQIDSTDVARDVAALARRLEAVTEYLATVAPPEDEQINVTMLDVIRAKHRREA